MTTDTAVLVSREILEEQKPLKSLKFVDDPEIPMDNGIVRFLDEVMPLENIPKMLDQNSET